MRDDLKAAFRSLRASTSFTAVALIVLTLGVGATTAIFSVVDAVVLRALPFEEHDRLVAVGERRAPGPTAGPSRDRLELSSIAPQNYIDWAARQQVFEAMAAIAFGAFTLREPGGELEELRSHRVTAGFFDVLRVHPAIGRGFTVEHEIDGNHRVTILSDALWRRRFSADPEIVGRMIRLEAAASRTWPESGGSYEVLGVMPPDFGDPTGAIRSTDLWVPYVVPPNDRIRKPRSRNSYLQGIARLKPDVSIKDAQAQMDQVAAAIELAHPEWNRDHRIGVRPLHDHIVGAQTRSWMLMLLGAVGMVLLIACANVANLLLARASAREREVGIRAALGAGRWRLIRQLMIESLVLSVAGTVLAVVFAWWGIQVLRASMPEGVPGVTQIAMDLRVLGAAAGLSILTGILFGIFPALQLSKPDLTTALKEGTRGASTGAGGQHVRSTFVVAEIALAVVLLVGAALFIGSFVTLMRINPGFNPERVLTAGVFPRLQPEGRPPDAGPAFAQILERISRAPGVTHGAIISCGMPLSGSMCTTFMTVPGRDTDKNSISIRGVTPVYFRALRIPLRRGRFFDATDRKGTLNVAIINESAAKKYFPGEDPLGRRLIINSRHTPLADDENERTIVGVVGDVHQTSLETEPREEVYVPLAQGSNPAGELVIQTSGDPYAVLPAVKAAVLAVLPDVPLRNVRTMEELLATRLAQRRFSMLLLGLFGLLGLVIAAVGIYGVTAYIVSQRTHEIGVRIALGATRGKVVGMVMNNACILVAAGLVIGGIGAWYLSAAAERFLFRVERNDPRAFAAALITLSLAALVASAIPARRAASVDPMVALRAQ
jgi:putative ABC transport system permease protein